MNDYFSISLPFKHLNTPSPSPSINVENTGTKKNVHNIVDNHISTERRTGRDLRNAYYHQSKYLLKKAQELESITGCIVNLEITPTWEKRVKKMLSHERV